MSAELAVVLAQVFTWAGPIILVAVLFWPAGLNFSLSAEVQAQAPQCRPPDAEHHHQAALHPGQQHLRPVPFGSRFSELDGDIYASNPHKYEHSTHQQGNPHRLYDRAPQEMSHSSLLPISSIADTPRGLDALPMADAVYAVADPDFITLARGPLT